MTSYIIIVPRTYYPRSDDDTGIIRKFIIRNTSRVSRKKYSLTFVFMIAFMFLCFMFTVMFYVYCFMTFVWPLFLSLLQVHSTKQFIVVPKGNYKLDSSEANHYKFTSNEMSLHFSYTCHCQNTMNGILLETTTNH